MITFLCRNRERDMKVLTFFTVRGGSGKTVLSAAFASYVSYILGKRAMVLDFDGPEYNLYNMRLRELSLMKEGDAECDRDGLYIVEKVENTDSDSLDEFAASIRRIKEQLHELCVEESRRDFSRRPNPPFL